MGVADPNTTPRSYNMAKMHNFDRSTNDVIRPLCYLHWFQIQKNLPEDSIPGAPVFFVLTRYSENANTLQGRNCCIKSQTFLKICRK